MSVALDLKWATNGECIFSQFVATCFRLSVSSDVYKRSQNENIDHKHLHFIKKSEQKGKNILKTN